MQREGLGAVGLRMERAKFLGLIEALEENLKEEGRESNEVALSQVLHGMDGHSPEVGQSRELSGIRILFFCLLCHFKFADLHTNAFLVTFTT